MVVQREVYTKYSHILKKFSTYRNSSDMNELVETTISGQVVGVNG